LQTPQIWRIFVLKLSIYAAYVLKNAFRSLIVMKTPLILASQSLRRQELLRQVGLDFEVIVSNTDETFPPDLPLPQIPIYIAEQKAYADAGYLSTSFGIKRVSSKKLPPMRVTFQQALV
jgi:hypothetical protein